MEDLLTGVSFMIIGMSVVFMFLVIMIIAMSITRVIISQLNKIFPEKEEALAAGPAPKDNTQEIAAAIAAAFAKKG